MPRPLPYTFVLAVWLGNKYPSLGILAWGPVATLPGLH